MHNKKIAIKFPKVRSCTINFKDGERGTIIKVKLNLRKNKLK